MVPLQIRQGRPDDAKIAAQLILSAAHALLVDLFGAGCEKSTLAYLEASWQLNGGQYGCDNHWVALEKNEVVGIITAWHTDLGTTFDRATLDSITHFFDLDYALDVLVKNQVISAELTPPKPNELMLGHIAVSPNSQGKGVGRQLVAAMEAYAETLLREHLVLDVHHANTLALRFYKKLGFNEQSVNGQFIRLVKVAKY